MYIPPDNLNVDAHKIKTHRMIMNYISGEEEIFLNLDTASTLSLS